MAVEKSPIRTIHVIATCRNCEGRWEDYRSAIEAARQHAETTGHRVNVERGQTWTYNP